MIRFIFLSIAFIAVSFTVAPIFSGISKQHKKLTQVAATDTKSDELTFDEIYALASETQTIDPAALNAIAPAAGEEAQEEKFSNGFLNKEDSALAEIKPDSATPKEITNF